MDITEVKKDLYKSKNMANFSHYERGDLFYHVEFLDGKYEFPIETITIEKKETLLTKNGVTLWGEIEVGPKLSEDLGHTKFKAEVKGSDLIRWIIKAYDSNRLKKIG